MKGVATDLRDFVLNTVMEALKACACGLRFTHDMPVDGCLHFLDLRISFNECRLCLTYCPQSKEKINKLAKLTGSQQSCWCWLG